MDVQRRDIARRHEAFRDVQDGLGPGRQLGRLGVQLRQLTIDRHVGRFPQQFLGDAVGGGVVLEIQVVHHAGADVAAVDRLAAVLALELRDDAALVDGGEAGQQLLLDEPLESLGEFLACRLVMRRLGQHRMRCLLEGVQHVPAPGSVMVRWGD
ncbi:MAG: hypothetical protein PW843_24880 [Azospirillaceae bacterium]|nr:hypothetical protein [Azospirillaceae bacterium]